MNDYKKIGVQAFSVLIGQWAIVGFALIDGAIAGHITPTELAALSIGAAIYLTVFVSLLGVIQAVLPIIGQLFGAQRYEEIGYQARQSLYLAAWISVLGLLCLLFPNFLLTHIANINPDRQALIQGYLNMLAIGFIPAVFFRIYVALNQAISKPLFVTVLQIGALIIKAPLAYYLAFHLDMGIAGCGLSSSIINCLLFLVGLIMLFKLPVYRPFQLFKKMELPAWRAQKDLMHLGIPIGISSFIEVASNTFMALFIARFQSDVFSAAHQLMVQTSMIMFQIPLSIAIASSAIVAQYIGARKMQQAQTAGRSGIKMSIGFTALACLLVFTLRHPFLGLFTDHAEVLTLAISLTGFILLYQLFDSAQITAAFILRAYKVAVFPTILYAITLWGVGLGGGYLIAFNPLGITPPFLQNPAGFWLASAVGLCLCGITLNLLLRFVSHKSIDNTL